MYNDSNRKGSPVKAAFYVMNFFLNTINLLGAILAINQLNAQFVLL